jgi:hypothetical protein
MATARIVTFANGLVLRELIVDVNDDDRRLVWAVGRWTVHPPQRFGAGVRRRCRPLPPGLDRRPVAHDIEATVGGLIEQALSVMKQTLERGTAG